MGMGIAGVDNFIPKLKQVLKQENLSGGNDIELTAGDDLAIPNATSQIRFGAGAGGRFLVFVDQPNGDVFRLRSNNQPGTSIVMDNFGVGNLAKIELDTDLVRFTQQTTPGIMINNASGDITAALAIPTNHSWAGTQTYTGASTFNANVTMNSATGGGSFTYNRTSGDMVYTPADLATSGGFLITKTETVRPDNPEYLAVSIDRSFSGAGQLLTLFDFSLTDTNVDITSSLNVLTLMSFKYLRSAGSDFAGAASNQTTMLQFDLSDVGTYTTAISSEHRIIKTIGQSIPVSNTAGNVTATLKGIDWIAKLDPINNGAGTATAEIKIITVESDYAMPAGSNADTRNFIVAQAKPTLLQIAGVTNFLGYEISPDVTLIFGGTVNSTGFKYAPTGAAISSLNVNDAFISIGGVWRNQADNAKMFIGGGSDVSWQFTGALYECTFEQATTAIVINQSGVDTNFIIESLNLVNMFHIDAGLDTITIGSATSLGFFAIDGHADEVQLVVQGFSTQTNKIFAIRNSANVNQLSVGNTGLVDYTTPQALGGGFVATLGTVGAPGPTVLTQNQWLQIQVNGVNNFIALWQ